MKYLKPTIVILMIFSCLTINSNINAQTEDNILHSDSLEISDSEKLVILWTSGDRDVAIKMVFMYTFNAKKYGWWKDITFIVWGPSAKLLSEDSEIQEYLKKMIAEGIDVKACKACADQYGVSDKLTELGVNVKYMGKELTEFIKGDRHVITF